MPRLPSGRNVCFDVSKIVPFAKQLYIGHEGTSPFTFGHQEELHHLIRVHKLTKSLSLCDLSDSRLLHGSLPMDASLVMTDQGLPLSQLDEYIASWPQGDQMFVHQFYTCDRVQSTFQTMFTQLNLWLNKCLNHNELNKNQPSLNGWIF